MCVCVVLLQLPLTFASSVQGTVLQTWIGRAKLAASNATVALCNVAANAMDQNPRSSSPRVGA
jgi:hypothetical protein